MPTPNAFVPTDLVETAKKIYSGDRVKLSLHKRLVTIYRPLYLPFHSLFEWFPSGARVVDIGCGTGILILLLNAAKGLGESVGYDIDRESIDIATCANTASHIRFKAEQDVPAEVLRNATVISLIDVLHHILPLQQKIDLLNFVLDNAKPGTTIIVKDLDPRPAWRAQANRVTDFLSTRSKVAYIAHEQVEAVVHGKGCSIKTARRMHQHVWAHYLVVGVKD